MTDGYPNKTVLLISAFPPPMGGAAKNSKRIAEAIEAAGCKVKLINTSVGASSHGRNLNYHVKRVSVFFRNLLGLIISLRGGVRNVYIVPDGGLGILYTFFYVLFCSIYSAKIWFHYRNFSYIDKKSRILKLSIILAGGGGKHIFLDEYMRACFDIVYGVGTSADSSVVYNTGSMDFSVGNIDIDVRNKKLVVGYLSNLCYEKGFHDVVKLIKCFDFSRYGNVFFHIAGNPVSELDRQLLSEVTSHKNVIYFGHLEGDEKRDFYINSNIFLFPTRFSQEAQPNVIWEALAAGAYPIAYNKGSIKWMLERCAGVIATEENISDMLVGAIEEIYLSGAARFKLKIKDDFDSVIDFGKKSFQILINRIVNESI